MNCLVITLITDKFRRVKTEKNIFIQSAPDGDGINKKRKKIK